jgi:hypothetical protein
VIGEQYHMFSYVFLELCLFSSGLTVFKLLSVGYRSLIVEPT